MKAIGIVLASNPGYSETFLINKISYLVNSGQKVIVFSDRDQNKRIENCKTVLAYQLPANSVLRLFKFLSVLLLHLLVTPKSFVRFLKLELGAGRSLTLALKNMYRSCHVFGYPLAWVHFEFATLTIGRENLAGAVCARLAVSLRGFDISLYPLHHPNCYNLLWTKLIKLHSISNDLYEEAVRLGYPREKPWKKITPAIRIEIIKAKIEAGTLSQPLKILSVGRLEWKKGYEYAIRAMASLKQAGIVFELKIVGEGSERESLAYSIVQQHLTKEVFLLGKLTHEKTLQLMHESDIYLQPSVQEGFCNALLEAQATGLLCIGTNAEGINENISHQETGWIVPRMDSEAIFRKILEIMELNTADRIKIATNAMNRVSTYFQLQNQIVQFQDFYFS